MKPFGLSGEIDLKLKVKLQLKMIIPPSPWPSAASGKSYWWTLLKWEMGRVGLGGIRPLVTRGGLERSYFCVTGQDSKPRPRLLAVLASPTSDQWSPEVPLEDPSHFLLQQGPPVGLPPGCWGLGMISLSWSFTFSLRSNLPNSTKGFIMKCLSQFWWSNIKEIYQSLNPVSVYYRNKAWIKTYRG